MRVGIKGGVRMEASDWSVMDRVGTILETLSHVPVDRAMRARARAVSKVLSGLTDSLREQEANRPAERRGRKKADDRDSPRAAAG